MKQTTLVIIVILAAVLLIGGCGCNGYNGLVQQDESVKKAWNNVQSDYQTQGRPYSDILLNTVKGEANFEQTTLQNVIQARASATQIKVDASTLTPEKLQQYQAAQGQLSQALGRLLAVAENYPTLRANDAFRGLQTQLEGTENRIKVSRNDFNAAVQEYNVKVRTFPMNIFAGMFGFHVREGFTADPGSQNAPKVDFSK